MRAERPVPQEDQGDTISLVHFIIRFRVTVYYRQKFLIPLKVRFALHFSSKINKYSTAIVVYECSVSGARLKA